MSQTRSSLLSRIKDLEDGPSWEEFDRLYRPLLMRYAASRGLGATEAEEIAQQCMASIAAGVQDFQRRVSFRGWLRAMIDHKVSDELRRRGRESNADSADLAGASDPEANPALYWEKEWNRTHLLYWLSQIRQDVSAVTYEAFELYVIQELPVAEIGRRLGMSPNQIYVAKHRVLKRLKERLRELDEGIL